MYTLYKNLSTEEQKEVLKNFNPKYHIEVIDGDLCAYCGMVLHNCVCTHDDDDE